MKLSTRGAAFISAHEGVVTKAYRDPIGVLTIGIGFTMRSAAFSRYWRQKHGRDLRMGDTMTRDECQSVLIMLVDEEYGPPVSKRLPNIKQHQYDAACSYLFNCGPGAIKDRWVTALASGDVSGAARLLRTSRVTAAGKRLKGLERRRDEEARLLETGNYGTGAVTRSSRVDMIREAQALLVKLGYDAGSADGVEGQKTKAAVLAYQQADANLVADGIIGPATLASLRIAAKKLSVAVEETPSHPDIPPAPEPVRGQPDDPGPVVAADDERPPVGAPERAYGLPWWAIGIGVVVLAVITKALGVW